MFPSDLHIKKHFVGYSLQILFRRVFLQKNWRVREKIKQLECIYIGLLENDRPEKWNKWSVDL